MHARPGTSHGTFLGSDSTATTAMIRAIRLPRVVMLGWFTPVDGTPGRLTGAGPRHKPDRSPCTQEVP